MRRALAPFLLLWIAFGSPLEKLDRCEIRYKKCEYTCNVKHPFDEKDRKACLLKCKAERITCKGSQKIRELKERFMN